MQTLLTHRPVVVPFLFTGILLSGIGCLRPAEAMDSRPNIILIMADDSAVDNYGCYGSTFFSTPRLDDLARTGIRFKHCYSEPVCTSSRVKIMTGRDGIRNYVSFGTLDRSETTFGSMMRKAGYATAVAGKWQLHGGTNGSQAPHCGFDSHCLWNYPGTTRMRYWHPSIVRDGQLLQTTAHDYAPDIYTQFVIDFAAAKRDRPFFIYYPMVLVHAPFIRTPDTAPQTASLSKSEMALQHFRDMVAYADKCVGRIVDALQAHGLRDNTVIIYTTDNGTARSLKYPYQNEQRTGEKAYATDGGCHVPLIINGPTAVPQGIVTEDIVDFSDFLPTLADIAGATLPDVPLDGRSFWAQCQGRRGDPREWIFQYYYPKFAPAAEKHGAGVHQREIVWAQNQHYKLYRDGALFAVADRYEKHLILPGTGSSEAEATRGILQQAIDSMPREAAKLKPKQ